ncbi:TetR family transcriptional regulator [Xylanibacillus composti]|uniref:HTH-type transcriptional regulator PksA n=3 Tax=Paenibacillaceae TaxID=186822 RepID=A0A8J4H345_9BACL|nr:MULTISPECIES: TetR/AcrR family transcriptional regulator [Paenibacillaceae]MBP1895867.1 AcrR family transcriptional regulator [Paenibacillus lactis]MDT9725226.1 TetR family transcriptional regulator [Xylanibacillus composti]GIQ64200.1 HTH-type transcriptional regulator PksA [Paenibacillus cisolokensis]GIQ70078.1 HTH-type transcriptional regulator PksA [Xylanibacillus composti]HAG01538.1 TetR family transcriptional regulator [Paenibacillus lactis]
MPKIVDHDHKRKIIAETAWKIIETEGIERASIRRIASEAGMSTGALRHYFSNQDELLLFIMEYFLARGRERSENISWSTNPLNAVRETLLELVPVNQDKQTETGVWLVFAIRSLTSAALNAKKDELTEGEYILMEALLEILIKAGYINKTINIEIETLRLAVIIEGLSIHALLRPDIFTIEKTEQIITHHLNELCNK